MSKSWKTAYGKSTFCKTATKGSKTVHGVIKFFHLRSTVNEAKRTVLPKMARKTMYYDAAEYQTNTNPRKCPKDQISTLSLTRAVSVRCLPARREMAS